MAVEDEKNEALEEVKDLEPKDEWEQELNEDEEEENDLGPEKKPPNKILIGLLSIVIFFALFMLFRGEQDSPQQVAEGPSITTPGAENSTPIPLPIEEAFEAAVLETPTEEPEEASSGKFQEEVLKEPSAGEILVQSEDGSLDSLTRNEVPAVSIPEKELAFFEALKRNRENRPTSAEQDAQLSSKIEKSPPLAKRNPEQKPTVKLAAKTRSRTPIIIQKKKRVLQKKKSGLAAKVLFTIQLGAFKKENSASALSERLIRGGYDAYILAVRDDLFRVRVGTFQSRADAKVLAKRIKSSDRLDSFIITK